MKKTHIRKASENDFENIWKILGKVLDDGDTYPYLPDTDQETAYNIWMTTPVSTYVAKIQDEIVGSYYIKPNQPGLGSHICNAGFIVSKDFRGQGIGFCMGEHSLTEAKRLGFLAMQFNLVVSTNIASIKLWKKFGFEKVGTLKKAFRHKQLGLIDAYVMYKLLD